ncbi:S49 family peptidase [Halomonas colorata]|uniref:S49 family peptidase n=1 Tax=Halomonas colorata TaxID=2742615 RepID=UPI0018679626|nr:S49 family peptidase [Halomonas colorata]
MESEQHIAVVDVNSPIQASNGVSANQIISGIRRALDNDATKALVLNINSPGGSPTESQRVYHALKDFRDRHDVPIVSYIRDMGASGAYYIAAGTDTIYASPSSIVGSIGVISASFGFTDAMENLGVERRVYTSGDNKAMLDPFLPEDPQTTERFSAMLGDVHQQFIDDVKEGRHALADTPYDDIVFSGAVWSGIEAVDVGLVDETLMLEELFDRLLPSDDGYPSVRNYSVRGNALEQFLRRMPGVMASVFSPATQDQHSIEMRY